MNEEREVKVGMGGQGCGRVVRMSRRVTGGNLVPICSFLVLVYLWGPGVLIPSEGNPGDQQGLASLSISLLLPPSVSHSRFH